jgi:hypothetical protein
VGTSASRRHPIEGSTVMADAEQVKDAAEAYIYGYPLVYDL